MITAKNAFIKTIANVRTTIPDDYMAKVEEMIQENIAKGLTSTILKPEDFGVKQAVKVMRAIEVYLKAHGYKVELGGGCIAMTIGWM